MDGSFYHPFPTVTRSVERDKIVTAREAVRLIRRGDTVATSGFVGIGFAEEIAIALEELFFDTRESDDGPRDLTLVYAGGQGDWQASPMKSTSSTSSR
jgi:propionate CoA-transferase